MDQASPGQSRVGQAGQVCPGLTSGVKFPQMKVTLQCSGENAGCNCSLTPELTTGMVDVRFCPWGERAEEKVLRSFRKGYGGRGQSHHEEQSPEETKINLKDE